MKLPKKVVLTDKDMSDDLLNEISDFINAELDEIALNNGYCQDGCHYTVKIICDDIAWNRGE